MLILILSLSEDIEAYLYRLAKLNIISDKIKLFSIFCKNTIEQQKLVSKPLTETHTIVNKSEFSANVENKFDFVIVD